MNQGDDSRSTGSNPSSVLWYELGADFLYISFSSCVNQGVRTDDLPGSAPVSDIQAVICSPPREMLLSDCLIGDLA